MNTPNWLRWTIIALGTLILSACNSLPKPPQGGLPTAQTAPRANMSQPRAIAGASRAVARYPVQQATHASGALPYPAHGAGCACCQGATKHPFAQQAVAHMAAGQQGEVVQASYPQGCPPGQPCGPPMMAYPQPHLPPNPCGDTGCQPGQWHPPGIACPWPEEEYLCDGGDQGVPVRIGEDWSVHGLNQEDTVVHYDTRDGKRIIEPTNKVCIYAPRFAAVRKLDGVLVNQSRERGAGVASPQPIVEQDQWQLATTAVQPLMPGRAVKSSAPIALEELQPSLAVDQYVVAVDFNNVLKAHEDFRIIERGILDDAEKPRLAQNVANALVWSLDKAAQVMLDRRQANVVQLNQSPQVTVQYNLDGEPRLQVCKVASKRSAQPGEIVEFTIRFDNIGTQTIGNVTIIDNLTTRLEYVPDSAECNVDGQFLSQENEGESLVLRYEVTEPMEPGEGGILRFKCRVR